MSDLTAQEQGHVRAALRFLRRRFGNWELLATALHFTPKTLTLVSDGTAPVSVTMAFRLARLASVPLDDVLSGEYPPAGACAHCGHVAPPA